ncbi:MAG TPA: hypothetical protein VGG63_09565 [Steroidobacteraceae bacterium]|jgi:hypothetical protein
MIRKHLFGTRLGSLLMAVREKMALLRTSLQSPEAVGTLYNDQLALRLAVGLRMLRIDAEGAELGVLPGAESAMSRGRPLIAFQSRPNLQDHSNPQANERANEDKARIWDWFAKRDYAVCAPDRVAHYDDGMALNTFLDSHLYPRRTTHYIAIPREKRLEVRGAARALLGL